MQPIKKKKKKTELKRKKRIGLKKEKKRGHLLHLRTNNEVGGKTHLFSIVVNFYLNRKLISYN
jgi:hypothetical protein